MKKIDSEIHVRARGDLQVAVAKELTNKKQVKATIKELINAQSKDKDGDNREGKAE